MIKKKANARKKSVKVTFELPAEEVKESASVVGSFNDWDPTAGEMTYVKARKVWKKEVSFDAGETVQFRYYIDGTWRNDADADGYETTPFASQNSVLEL